MVNAHTLALTLAHHLARGRDRLARSAVRESERTVADPRTRDRRPPRAPGQVRRIAPPGKQCVEKNDGATLGPVNIPLGHIETHAPRTPKGVPTDILNRLILIAHRALYTSSAQAVTE